MTDNDGYEDENIASPAFLSAEDLGLPTSAAKSLARGTFSQMVEPLRDGLPWCDWDAAEEMLVQAAFGVTRGAAGLKPKGYELIRDDTRSTLSLRLTEA